MDEIYANVDHIRPDKLNISTSPTGPTSSDRRCHGAVVLSLSLLSVFLLAGLIGLGVHYHGLAAELSSVKSNLTEHHQIRENKSLSLTEERDQLKSTLIEVTKERDRLQILFERKKTCPTGWTIVNGSCYIFSSQSGFWKNARNNCRDRGADLVVIDSNEEQTFLSGVTSDEIWIGLTDKNKEGVWEWVDGTPLNFTYWAKGEPNDGQGAEDCAHINRDVKRNWNDLSCDTSLKWICERMAF